MQSISKDFINDLYRSSDFSLAKLYKNNDILNSLRFAQIDAGTFLFPSDSNIKIDLQDDPA